MSEPRLSDYRRHYSEDGRLFDYGSVSDPRSSHANRRLYEETARALYDLPRGLRILDVGSGGGYLSGALGSRGMNVIALDLSTDSLAAVRNRWSSVRVAVGDAYSLPAPDSSLDAVVATEVLEHLERPRDAAAEARRVIRPGGRYVVTVPYRQKLVYHLCVHCNRPTPAHAHLREYDESRLREHLGDGWSRVVARPFVQTQLNLFVEAFGLAGLPRAVWRFADSLAFAFRASAHYLMAVATRDESV
jgi:SAM-dependent methyltransferase